ncbi:HEAT repeat domain-containing protein [Pontibacter kalidii]|uniref:HEAT repeat domain-containing protein n=1 Tax=Pontibacter kalidii TaxID=2592049 RepID=UPI00224EE3D0|nr:HEAT repeat domain-containing protein [Pontibacter kalidii]
MRDERQQVLILDYLEGNLDEAQQKEFEALVQTGEIREEELQALQATFTSMSVLPDPQPGAGLQAKFNRMLAAKIEQAELAKPQYTWADLWQSMQTLLSPVRLAYTLVVFAFGFFAAWLAFSPSQQQQPNTDTQMLAMELSQVRQMLFATLIEQPAAVDRLRAVNISSEIVDADEKVIGALFNSLNHDPNVNVRLAAVEALKKHTANPQVREQLILSINKQESPMVQIALADLMQDLQERNAVPQLKQLLQDENTNEQVKDKIKESINVLI